MTKKPRISKQKAISEIVKGLRKGLTVENILKLIGTKWNLPRTTYYRYLDEAEEIHYKEQQEAERIASEQLIKSKKEELKSDIISIQQRKEYLTRVITAETDLIQLGKSTVEVLTHDDGRREIITNALRINALQELNRMDGAYAIEDINVNHKGLDVLINVERRKK